MDTRPWLGSPWLLVIMTAMTKYEIILADNGSDIEVADTGPVLAD